MFIPRSVRSVKGPLNTNNDTLPEKNTTTLVKNKVKKKQSKVFRYGNYDQYYGYRNKEESKWDPRLSLIQAEWVNDKRILDIGCNAGLLTIQIAQKFHPQSIEGVDIDIALIWKARKALEYQYSRCTYNDIPNSNSRRLHADYIPQSAIVEYGSLPLLSSFTPDNSQFPHNVKFRATDWIHEPVPLAGYITYDTIFALSITKWIHLNNGDEGLISFFKKCYHALSPRGIFILEIQPWSSYGKRAHLCPEMTHHWRHDIQIKPDQFISLLTSNTIGFRSFQELGVSLNPSKGFQRSMIALYR